VTYHLPTGRLWGTREYNGTFQCGHHLQIWVWNVTVSIFQDSHISNRSGTMHLGCLEWHGTYPDWRVRCIKAWCLLYYLKSLSWQHCSLPEFRTDVKLTGVFARKPRLTQTLSVDTQYIPPWVSKISSDIMAYGEAGNGNGNRNRNGKGNGKVKLKKSCMVLSNYWTGLTQTTSFSAVQKLYMCLFSVLLAPELGQASFLQSVEV